MALSCGCTELYVWSYGHRGECRWAGASALSYPGVREWQRMQGNSDRYADEVVARAVRDGAPLDACYPSHDHVWRTFGEAIRIVQTGPHVAVPRSRHARADAK